MPRGVANPDATGKKPKVQKVWIVGVRFRDREKWLPLCVVTINGGASHTALSRGTVEAKKKLDVGRRRIYEITANVKPALRADPRLDKVN